MSARRNFLGLPEEYADPRRARFVVLPVPWEHSTTYKTGTQYGPMALIEASHRVELYDEELGFEPWKSGVHTLPPPPFNRDPAEYLRGVADAAEPQIRAGKFLFTVGGEHAVSEGALAGVVRAHPKVSVLHLDAHCDPRDCVDGDPYAHAWASRRMSAHVDKVVQIGVRSVWDDDHRHLESKKIRVFFAQKEKDPSALARKVLDELGDTVYLSIGLDVFDPAVVPGVPMPVPAGLGWQEVIDLLRAVIRSKNVVAADVVELCPHQDSVLSQYAAARIMYRMMAHVVHKESQKVTVRRVAKPRGKR